MGNFSEALQKGADAIYQVYKANAPKILTGVCVGGALSTFGLTITATVKSVRKIDAYKLETGKDKLTFGEVLKLSWKPFIFPLIALGTTVGSAIGAYTEADNQNKAWIAAGLQGVANTKADILEAAKEVVGEEKADAIKEKVSENQAKAVAEKVVIREDAIQNFGHGDDIFVETILGMPLRGDYNTLEAATNAFNQRITAYGETPYWEEWWDLLGIKIDSHMKYIKCDKPIILGRPIPIEAASMNDHVARALVYRGTPFMVDSLIDTVTGRLPWQD